MQMYTQWCFYTSFGIYQTATTTTQISKSLSDAQLFFRRNLDVEWKKLPSNELSKQYVIVAIEMVQLIYSAW
jgi:hypothetical protein